ncbi:MAG: glycoside hydrolase family 9 protein [Oscillospiraceae bacterium]|nr:glycoside hydrolase family 9 protein [Oscillospiraceae bacterium]
MKKLLSTLIAATVLVTATVSTSQLSEPVSAETNIDYAEALQKSLFFYECQQAGPLPEWNRVEWRDDSTMNDFVTGGWYDAGDHVKFNLPMAYSASMLAWGLYQYPDGIEKCGEMTNYVNNLTFVMDYLAACDLGDEVVYQVGNGQEDHTWWGPVELYEYGMEENGNDYSSERPYYTAKKGEGYSAVLGGMAAALAAGASALEGRSDKTDEYIEHAKNIFEIADGAKSNEDYNNSDASGFYRSSHFYDELFWAANWLYIATDDKSYLDKAASYIPYLDKELGSDEMKYSWSHCWDDVMQGGLLLYAQNTGSYVDRVKKHLDYLVNYGTKVDDTLIYIQNWGCLRYATTCGFITAVACDTLSLGDTSKYEDFYESQIDYALGDNPLGQSYVVGYGEKSPLNAHHRTAHASWNNSLDNPTENRHILYGALVGGPNQDGTYDDDRGNFINNEVATDYNAGFTGLLCKMVDKYGGTADPSFPEPETRDAEFFVEATLKQSSASGVSLSLKFTNHTAWPARVVDNMSYRYYFDASEIINAGFSASDVVVRVDRDQAKMYGEEYAAVISPVTQYKDNIYYIEVAYPNGEAILPISEGRNQCETMLALVFPNYGSGWDAENDYSNADIMDTVGAEEGVITDKITVYNNGVLVYGVEPDGTKPEETVPSQGDSTLKGDLDVNGSVETADAVLMCKFLLGGQTLKEQQRKNADVTGDKKINIFDFTSLKRNLL